MEVLWQSPENYRFDQDMFTYFRHLYSSRHDQCQKDLNRIHLTDSRIHVIYKDDLTSKEEAVEVIKKCETIVREFQTEFCKDTDFILREQELAKAREVIESLQAETNNAILVLEQCKNDVIVLIIMAMSHNVIQRCKHKLKVGLKRITIGKPRAERKIRTDDAKQSATSVLHSVDEEILTGNGKPLMTYEGMKVCVYKKDIVEWDDPTACVVNPINADFKPTGSVPRALLKKGGDEFKKCMRKLSAHEPRKPGYCEITNAYNLKVPRMLNVVCPSRKLSPDVLNGQKCNRNIFNCVYNCMVEAEKAQMNTVVFPFLFTGTLGRPVNTCSLQYAYAVLEYSRVHKTQDSSLQKVVFVSLKESDIDVSTSVFSQTFPSSYCQFFRIIEEMPYAVKGSGEPNTKTSDDEMREKTDTVTSTSTDTNDHEYMKSKDPGSSYCSLSRQGICRSSDTYDSLEVCDTDTDSNDHKHIKSKDPGSNYSSLSSDAIGRSGDAYDSLAGIDTLHLLDDGQQSHPEEHVGNETNLKGNEYYNIPMLSPVRDMPPWFKTFDTAIANGTNWNNADELNVSGRLVEEKNDVDSGCKNIPETECLIKNLNEHTGICENVDRGKITSANETEPKATIGTGLEKSVRDNDKSDYDKIDESLFRVSHENVASIESENEEVREIKPNVITIPNLNEQESCTYRRQTIDQHISIKGSTRQSYIQNFGGKIEVIFVNKDIRNFNSVAIVSPVADIEGKPDDINGNDLIAAAIKAAYHLTFFSSAHEKKLQKLSSHKSQRKYATYTICNQEDFRQGRAKYIFHVVLPTYRSIEAMSKFRKGLTTAFDALMTKIEKVNKKDDNAVRELALPLFGLNDSLDATNVKAVCHAIATCLHQCIASKEDKSMRYLMRKIYIVNWCPRVISLFEEAFTVVHSKHQN